MTRAGEPSETRAFGASRLFLAIVTVVLLALAWMAAPALLIIFAGVLVAVGLEALTRPLDRFPISYRIRLGIVVLVLAILAIAGFAWGGATLFFQARQLLAAVDEQVRNVIEWASGAGVGLDGGNVGGLLPDMSQVFGGATNAFFALFGAVGNLLVIVFLSIFLAAEPKVYGRAAVSLVPPPHRQRFAEVLEKSGAALRGWLMGQSISMAVVFLVTWGLLAAIGMGYPFLLGLQAGLLVFIPTLGPVLAGVVIVLSGLAEGAEMALWGLGVYVVIQLLESNVLTPLVQEQAVRLPPAFTLAFQLIMGALFGLLGVALAVPICAAVKVFVGELYVKDMLGGGWKEKEKAA